MLSLKRIGQYFEQYEFQCTIQDHDNKIFYVKSPNNDIIYLVDKF